MTSLTSAVQQNAAAKSLLLSSALALFARMLIATIFVLSGMSKVIDPGGTISYIASAGLPFPTLALILAIVTEVLGGAALILGYRTRWVAAALAVFSIAAAFAFHAQLGDQNQLNHFLKNLAIAGGLLQVAAFGAGRFSFDARS
jgi:putative oxidoreductase